MQSDHQVLEQLLVNVASSCSADLKNCNSQQEMLKEAFETHCDEFGQLVRLAVQDLVSESDAHAHNGAKKVQERRCLIHEMHRHHC